LGGSFRLWFRFWFGFRFLIDQFRFRRGFGFVYRFRFWLGYWLRLRFWLYVGRFGLMGHRFVLLRLQWFRRFVRVEALVQRPLVIVRRVADRA
jgi:hypothetical protein